MRLEDKLAAYLEYCEYRKELDRKTLKAYRIDLRQYFEYICVDEPDKEKIEEYVTHLHKSYKQKTVKRKIASIKAFYNYLEETEIIAESPFRKIKVKFKETVQAGFSLHLYQSPDLTFRPGETGIALLYFLLQEKFEHGGIFGKNQQ